MKLWLITSRPNNYLWEWKQSKCTEYLQRLMVNQGHAETRRCTSCSADALEVPWLLRDVQYSAHGAAENIISTGISSHSALDARTAIFWGGTMCTGLGWFCILVMGDLCVQLGWIYDLCILLIMDLMERTSTRRWTINSWGRSASIDCARAYRYGDKNYWPILELPTEEMAGIGEDNAPDITSNPYDLADKLERSAGNPFLIVVDRTGMYISLPYWWWESERKCRCWIWGRYSCCKSHSAQSSHAMSGWLLQTVKMHTSAIYICKTSWLTNSSFLRLLQ